MSDFNINKCPHCGSTSIVAQASTWINFENGEPASYDAEGHLDCADPIVGGGAYCLSCDCDVWNIERVAGQPLPNEHRAYDADDEEDDAERTACFAALRARLNLK